MSHCSQCQQPVDEKSTDSGTWFICESCGAKGVPDSYVQNALINGNARASEIIKDTQAGDEEVCPGCDNYLKLGRTSVGDQSRVIGRCDRCEMTWFPSELGQKISSPEFNEDSLQNSTSKRSADSPGETTVRTDDGEEKKYIGKKPGWTVKAGWNKAPSNLTQWAPAFFGFPVKLHSSSGKPVGTWLLAVVTSLVFVMGLGNFETLLMFGFRPDRWYRWGGVTALTSFFIHGGLFHLVGNLYYLIVFGQDVELVLGTKRYLLLIFGATIIGDLIFALLQWGGSVPGIGASGGVAGVIAYFAFAYPEQRFGYAFVPIIFYPIWFKLRAFWGFLIWFGFQFLGARSQVQGTSGINSLAHIGGAAAGFAFWLYLRER